MPLMNTLLMGPRACGKTTIGRLLAQRAGLPFVDLDERVLAGFSAKSVREVWTLHGERAWRDAEVTTLENLLQSDGQIIALGGGTPMIPKAQLQIEQARATDRAQTIYLKCPVEILTRRLARDAGDRISLTGAGVVEENAGVVAQRHPTYQAIADVVIEVGEGTQAQIVDQLVPLLPT